MLTKEQILEADDLKREWVATPEWGKDSGVYVRTISGTERDQFETAMVQGRTANTAINLQNVRARLAVFCVVDEDGKRLFQDEDAAALGKKSCKALDRIFECAQRLNGMRKEDIEELGKPSTTTQS